MSGAIGGIAGEIAGGVSRVVGAIPDYLPFVPKRAPRFVTEDGRRVWGVMAEFDSPERVYHAAEKIRDAGYAKWDVSSPFPIHGMEEAMGQRKTILPYIVFKAGIAGVVVAILIQYYMNVWDYGTGTAPGFIVQGKPASAWEAYLPIMFELGVLHAAFAALIGMLMLNGLPRHNHPLFRSERFLSTSDDRFVVAIEAEDPAFDPEKTPALLEELGGTGLELVEEDA